MFSLIASPLYVSFRFHFSLCSVSSIFSFFMFFFILFMLLTFSRCCYFIFSFIKYFVEYLSAHGMRWSLNASEIILTWRRGYSDQKGCSPSMSPYHCTTIGMTAAIIQHMNNSFAQFLVAGACVRACPYLVNYIKTFGKNKKFQLRNFSCFS